MPVTKWKPTKCPGVFTLPDGRLMVMVAHRDIAGRQIKSRKIMAIGATLTEAVKVSETLKAQLTAETRAKAAKTQRPKPSIGLTFEAYVLRWASTKAALLKPSTRRTYEGILGQKILPQLGYKACAELTRDDVIDWTAWATSQKQSNGKPYSGDTVRSWWRPLKMILQDMSADLNLQDVTARVAPPRIQGDRVREAGTLTHSELHALLDAVGRQFPDHHAEVAVMAYTAMRAGEVFALKWDCIDFERQEIKVRRSISAGVLTETTKTHGARTVPMAAELVAILKRHRQRQIAICDPALRNGLVFGSTTGRTNHKTGATTEAGQPRCTSVLVGPLAEAAKAVGIQQKVTPQVLRRTWNTLMALAGADRITIRAIMGHSSEQMTERYAGVSTATKLAAVRVISGGPAG